MKPFMKVLAVSVSLVLSCELLAPFGAHAATTYQSTWESVDQHKAAPEWFQDAKFGIYYHWGVFSVPAYGNEWYPRNMYVQNGKEYNHHVSVYGSPTSWPYHNFINGAQDKNGNWVEFAPKMKSAGGQFDPNEWAQLFVDAGAKFAGPVAEHHDGYSMWDSSVNEWNSVDKGPHLDLLGTFATAIRNKNLKLLTALHHAYNSNGYFQYAPAQSDPSLMKLYGQLPKTQEDQLWYDKLKEVIDTYQPDILWQDFALTKIDEAQRLKFLSYYYNKAIDWGKEVVATYKTSGGFNLNGEVVDYERGGPAELTSNYWLTDDSVGGWSYTPGMSYYSAPTLLHSLIDRVSKNGNLLLNIAPMADGTIPQEQKNILLGMGDWLKRYGESIYSTRAWTKYGEGPTQLGGAIHSSPIVGTETDIRFTRNKSNNTLYAIVLGWPGNGVNLNISTLNSNQINLSTLSKVQLLGETAGTYINLSNRVQSQDGLKITMPASKPFTASAYVVKLTFTGKIPDLHQVSGPTFYKHVQYEGNRIPLSLGNYTKSTLQAAGIADNSISSILVPSGYKVTAYAEDNYSGTSWTFASNNNNLKDTGNNDLITSLKISLDSNAYFKLANRTTDLVLDGGGSVASGSNVKESVWNSSNDAQWRFVNLGTGYYQILNRTNGLALDGAGSGTAPGTNTKETTWTGSENQQWQLADLGDGFYKIANRANGLVLTSSGNFKGEFIPPVYVNRLSTWNGSTLQQWKIVKVN
ncbi:alpha-L-fucosidase [Paenibacillus sp. MAH-36]|uniref:alpha-L-fucosidase n=1 Tax=Paenibacillus violae TaxID=3077234 RepID=A0ABU3R703_9BACL|nr:alpha-L-fucosidase [Paenibacillus sp. PFR10]MDU0199662.1 alpha-L-fucosidase [Paenibacillus sp. PFR10]